MNQLAKRALNYPSAERNKSFILKVLKEHIVGSDAVSMLEVSSGTGQHAGYFAANLPNVTIQPTEVDESLFESISAYAEQVPGGNMKNPVKLDVLKGPWNLDTTYQYLLNVNMFHVAPLSCAVALFTYGSQVLAPGGLMFTYGPYADHGRIEPQSNIDFDRAVRRQNPEFGLRDIQDLKAVASQVGIYLKHQHNMPANNKVLVWEKVAN